MNRRKSYTALAFVAISALAALAPARTQAGGAPVGYTLVDVGALNPNYAYSQARALNNLGHVVGISCDLNYKWHGFCWKDRNGNRASDAGEMTDLGHLGGSSAFNESSADGISQSGQYVVGSSLNEQGVLWGYRWNDADNDGIVGAGERTVLWPLDQGTELHALGVNDQGQVVGWYALPNGQTRAFLWNDVNGDGREEEPEMVLLGNLGGSWEWPKREAYAINNAGQVAGYSYTPEVGERGFLFRDLNGDNVEQVGESQDVGTLVWDARGAYLGWGRALDVNESGMVTGAASSPAPDNWPGFFWFDTNGDGRSTPDEIRGLDPSGYWMRTRRLNDSGDAVGWNWEPSKGLWVPSSYVGGKMQRLEGMVPDGVIFYDVWRDFSLDINNSGWISATLSTPATQGASRAHLLIPIPANQPPAASSRMVDTREDLPATITLSGSDPEDAPLGYEILSQPSHGKLSANNNRAKLRYTPEANYNGTDSFTYRVSDGSAASEPATITIEIAAVNDFPVAKPQTVSAVRGRSVSLVLDATDADRDTLKFEIVTKPRKGTLKGSGANRTYTASKTGTDSFTYRVTDGNGGEARATVTLKIK